MGKRGWEGLPEFSKALYKDTYFLEGEIYEEWLHRVTTPYQNDEVHGERIRHSIRNYWAQPSTPISSGRGLPISCYVSHVGDSRESIFSHYLEGMWLGAEGGGRGVNWSDVRAAGAPISSGSASSGIIPFLGISDRTTYGISQAGVRRSTETAYLHISHPDMKDFMDIRLETGDRNRRTPNLHHSGIIPNSFMEAVESLSTWDLICPNTKEVVETVDAYELFMDILEVRKTESGEPNILYIDNVNDAAPQEYKTLGLKTSTSNICCLAGDTLVATSEGPTEIRELVGKTTTIYDGESWVGCDNFKEYPEDELLRIHFKNGTYVDSNPNHRWFAAESYNDIKTSVYRERTTSTLKIGSWVENKIHEAAIGYGEKDLPAAYAKGFLIGDGTQNGGRPMLNVHFPKYMCENSIVGSVNELPVENTNTNSITTVSFSSEVHNPDAFGRQMFKQVSGLSVRKKALIAYTTTFKEEFPDLSEITKDGRYKFLSGLLDADGTYSTSGIQLSSISLNFIRGLQSFLFTLGVTSSIDSTPREGRNDMFRVTIGSYDSFELFTNLYCQRLEAPEVTPNRRTTGYRQVTTIEKLPGKASVYCPQVPTTKKFLLANGMMTGNTEINLYTAEDTTAICCLASQNLEHFDEYEDVLDELVADWDDFLNNVIQSFIDKTEDREGFERARRSAMDSRDTGFGVMGWHSLLQKKRIPFESPMAVSLNKKIFSKIRAASEKHQLEVNDPCPMAIRAGTHRRNIHTQAVAPTLSISTLCDLCSSGIEPLMANEFSKKVPTGTFRIRNKYFQVVLEEFAEGSQHEKESWIAAQWKLVTAANGSVQGLEWLSLYLKDVFKTAYEINQLALIGQAGDRAPYIDQGQSLNIFVPAKASYEELYVLHMEAWRRGVKSMYYLRSEPAAYADTGKKERQPILLEDDSCVACT